MFLPLRKKEKEMQFQYLQVNRNILIKVSNSDPSWFQREQPTTFVSYAKQNSFHNARKKREKLAFLIN